MAEKPVIFFTNLFGWSTRNFFQTGVMDLLIRDFRVVVLASPQMKCGLEKLGWASKVEIVEHLPEVGGEPFLWRLCRQARKKLYTESRHSVTEATFAKYRARPFYMRVGAVAFQALTAVIPAMKLYWLVDWLDYAINRDSSMRPLFERYQPLFVFHTHATHYGDEIIFRNALSAGVPTVYMVLSWDHLATAKILLSRRWDRILVWNEHSRRELLSTYDKIPAANVHVVGIPQYDFYAQKPSHDYTHWCARYGLDPAKRTILFSTMPQIRHDQQHIILDELMRWITAPANADLNAQILVKTHPFDAFPGYAEVQTRYPMMGLHRTSLPPDVKQDQWVPEPDEIQAGRDCLYFCAININIFSTVTIEASYFDKPVIHLAFDPLPVHNRIPCREYYNWDHFRHIMETGASILVENYEELFAAIRTYAQNPGLKQAERQKVVRTYIGKPVGSAAREVASNLVLFADELRQRGQPTPGREKSIGGGPV